MILNMAGGAAGSGLPRFTYTGSCQLLDDGKTSAGRQNWRLKLLTSGTLTFAAEPGTVDVFLVGGGGGTLNGNYVGGGGGGYVKNLAGLILSRGVSYAVTIGAGGANGSGGSTSAFGHTEAGGRVGGGSGGNGGDGGSGGGGGGCPDGVNMYPLSGDGGTNGGNGKAGRGSDRCGAGGNGGGVSTYEFGDTRLTLYSSGGAGKGAQSVYAKNGAGASGANSGCGASLEPNAVRAAGSGVVVIRNHR